MISEQRKRDIQYSLLEGRSIDQIIIENGVSKATIYILKAAMNINLSANNHGRPAKLSSQSKHICTRMILSVEYRSATSVQKKLEMDNIVSASLQTETEP
ncbi:hypothetical protein AX774_g6988 [Zancudomyces culisetae]|uniref:Resolvase HTH domain-containing protein n=1 Tax=Zancudomyces culisetae TaxID=1213189 RepID=A0A1R1PF40_ZANCU|nr:hypothetical protein AX774_g6988 [Zancudomyces culisetae]|eukprot:OMH79594.1 hypothetical protein AX774_g6988 [Zancudomyces culisetae]